jgi:hypothetical protein
MSFKYHFLFLTLIGSLINVRIANACDCSGTSTVLASYEGASVVVIVRAVAAKEAAPGEGYEGISSTKMVIEKVFKGNLKAGDEMTFGQGHGGGECIWSFGKPGQRFLFYLSPWEKRSNMWYVSACSRSRYLQGAEDLSEDLLYLNRLKELSGKTRISGTIKIVNRAGISVEGRTIRILGGGKSYEAKTNKNGVYEIYDLPAGKYRIAPEVPMGWKLAEPWLHYTPPQDRERLPENFSVVLEDKGQVSLDIHYEMDSKSTPPASRVDDVHRRSGSRSKVVSIPFRNPRISRIERTGTSSMRSP